MGQWNYFWIIPCVSFPITRILKFINPSVSKHSNVGVLANIFRIMVLGVFSGFVDMQCCARMFGTHEEMLWSEKYFQTGRRLIRSKMILKQWRWILFREMQSSLCISLTNRKLSTLEFRRRSILTAFLTPAYSLCTLLHFLFLNILPMHSTALFFFFFNSWLLNNLDVSTWWPQHGCTVITAE